MKAPAVMNDPIRFRPENIRKSGAGDLAIRFAFGFAVSLAAAVVAKVWGAAFGGLFLAFPAILPAALTLIEDKESTRDAKHNDLGAIAGVPGLAAFGLSVWLLHDNAWAALLVGLGAWIVVAVGLALLYRWFRSRKAAAHAADQDVRPGLVWRSAGSGRTRGGRTATGHDI
jgi:uncharacterized membrane protein (GlpM family)